MKLLSLLRRKPRQARVAPLRRSAPPRVRQLEARTQPAVHTWTGAVSGCWSDAGNWRGGTPAGDKAAQLIFPGVQHEKTTNDLTGLSIDSITIKATNYWIRGKDIQLGAGGIVQEHGNDEIDLNIQLATDVGVSVNGASLRLRDAISGAYSLSMSGSGTLILTGQAPNTFTDLDVQAGQVFLGKPTGVSGFKGSLTIGDGVHDARVYTTNNHQINGASVAVNSFGSLFLGRGADTLGALTLNGGPGAQGDYSVDAGAGIVTLAGDVTAYGTATTYPTIHGDIDLGGTARLFDITAGELFCGEGSMFSDGKIVKQGNGTLDFNNSPILPYQITNGPANWGQTGASMNNFYTFAVENGALFAGGRVQKGSVTGSTACLLYSTDGQTWSRVNVPFRTTDNEVRALWVGPDGYLYLASQGTARIYRSPDGLTDWQLVVTLDSSVSYGSSFATFNGSIYLGCVNRAGSTAAAFIYTSTDGVHWSVAAQLPGDVHGVQSMLSNGGVLYASTDEASSAGGVFTSADGATWVKANTSPWQGSAHALVNSLTIWNGALWAGTEDPARGGAVFSSSDGGGSWTPASTPGFGSGTAEPAVSDLAVVGNNLFATTYNPVVGGRFWVTNDRKTWYELGAPGSRLGSLYQGIFDSVEFNGQLYSAQRCPSVSSAVPSRPMYIATVSDPVVVDAGAVQNEVVVPT
jgi:hypothetical protein